MDDVRESRSVDGQLKCFPSITEVLYLRTHCQRPMSLFAAVVAAETAGGSSWRA